MADTGRVRDHHRRPSCVPVFDVLGGIQDPRIREAAEECIPVCLEVVEHQHRLPRIHTYDLIQRVQFLLMDLMRGPVRVIDESVRHLQELSHDRCRGEGRYILPVFKLQELGALHLPVRFHLGR